MEKRRIVLIDELRKLGAQVEINDRVAKLTGIAHYHGAEVTATDLRAGAALVIAGLMADGVTESYNIKYIDRGYEDVEFKFRALGADIERIKG